MTVDSKLLSNPRYIAITLLQSVLEGCSLSDELPKQTEYLSDSDRRFTQHLVFGTLRHYDELVDRVGQMLQKPIKPAEIEVKLSHLLAAYELTEMATAEYALVNNWVNLIKAMGKQWATGLTNAILRNIQRKKFPEAKTLAGQMNLPNWFAKRLQTQWGEENLKAISAFYKLHPEMILRVNRQKTTRESYINALSDANVEGVAHDIVSTAIVLTSPTSVDNLPGFFQGVSSVQDASAQLAATILAPSAGDVVLDACAAPGGKTTGLLEFEPKLSMLVALDSSAERLKKVAENIDRTFDTTLTNITLAATACEEYHPDFKFDKILLDVPCSATGILHRHPDIKRLRKAEDIQSLQSQQRIILEHAWTLLKAGGKLLYATCSILKDENEQQIRQFMATHKDAKEIQLNLPIGIAQEFGVQILPTLVDKQQSMDGFYYCLLEKFHD